MGFDIVKKFQEGGWAMWPLLLCAVLGIAFAFERLIVLFLQKRMLRPDQFLEEFEKSMKRHNGNKDAVVTEMYAYCKKRGGVCANIMREGLEKYQQARFHNLVGFDLKQWLNNSIQERAAIELPQLESHLGIINVVAIVSPLLGLLGTVFGMIQAFDVMAASAGGAKPDELAGGISVALITTAAGMIIAIPALVLYNWVKTMIENYVMLVEEAAIHMVDSLMKERMAG